MKAATHSHGNNVNTQNFILYCEISQNMKKKNTSINDRYHKTKTKGEQNLSKLEELENKLQSSNMQLDEMNVAILSSLTNCSTAMVKIKNKKLQKKKVK